MLDHADARGIDEALIAAALVDDLGITGHRGDDGSDGPCAS
jgi:predicted HD phosphohydrolase